MNYFDHAASTYLYPEVLDLLNKSLREDFANPHSQHMLGTNLFKKIEEARAFFLKDTSSFEFIFTSSATESNNTIIRGLDLGEGDIVLYSKADHPSVVETIEKLSIEKKFTLKVLTVDKKGTIEHEELKRMIANFGKEIKLVTLTSVNNQSGVINDIACLAKLIKEKTKAHIHVDAVQSFTKIPCDYFDTIDSMSITSHKIGGPKGIAGLYFKKNLRLKPLLLGGGQEGGWRASTVNYPLVMSFTYATQMSLKMSAESLVKIQNYHNMTKLFLTNLIPTIKFPFDHSSPYILTFIVPGIPSDVMLRHLEVRGFYLSSTSACSSRKKGFHPTLGALNIPENFHKNVIRLSFGRDTSIDSVNLLLEAFRFVWQDLKFLMKK